MSAAGILFPTVPNFRDIGDYPSEWGGRVRLGRIFRSEAISAPDDLDARGLERLKMALICDLRGHNERERLPNSWWRSRGVEILNLDILADIRESHDAWELLRGDSSARGGRAIMIDIYRTLPFAAAGHLKTICERVVAGHVPLLIHCAAGKDRTGFICAALLRILGVANEMIMHDYLSSAGRMRAEIRSDAEILMKNRIGVDVNTDAIDAIMHVSDEYLNVSFESIVDNYGSFENFVKFGVGLNDYIISVFRRHMID